MANYNVYLSSTFRDLEEYRKAVLELFRYISDDFTVTAMEGYTAENKSALEKCIEDVEKCDIYILLLGNRYGHIPENNAKNQNPDRKSITHLEFETAINPANKKKVLVYHADINNNDGVLFMEDDDGPEKEYKKNRLQALRKSLSEGRLSPKPFVKPADLSLLVSASLITLIQDESGKGYNESVKYCCDRSTQFNQYGREKSANSCRFQVFITNGNELDTGANLVNRCAIFSLGLRESEIITLAFAEFYNSDNPVKNRDDFFYVLYNKIFQDQPPVTDTQRAFTDALLRKPGGFLVIRMTCSEEFLDDKKIDFLSGTFILLHQVCSGYSEDFKKKIYFFLNLEDKGEEPAGFPSTDEKLKALQRNLSASDVRAVFLDRFYMVNREHIENWIENYFTKDEEAKDELFDVHFASLPPSFRMRHAEKSIRQLFKRIREHDPAIINIFNK